MRTAPLTRRSPHIPKHRSICAGAASRQDPARNEEKHMTNIVPTGDHLDHLPRTLEQEARLFAARSRNAEAPRSRSWIVLDLEFLFDRSRYEAYSVAEGKDAEEKIRWPFHQVAAVCWMKMEFVRGEPVPMIEGPVVLAAGEMDERTMVSALFTTLENNPAAIVTTWGGEARDLAVLRRAAATHDLQLPHQLIDGSPYARERLDLCRATCVQADSVHLPEMAAAVSVPCKPSPSKKIGVLCQAGDWSAVRDQVLADVLTTSVLAVRYLAAHREIECHRADTVTAIADAALSTVPNSGFARRTFAPWARGEKAASQLRGVVYRAAA